MLRVVIIEDEPATARNLKTTLEEIDQVSEVATILNSVEKSIDWFNHHPGDYDLIFMDIRLSDGICFEIINKAQLSAPVIFITAYEDYTFQAFKTNGIDYILKPFEKEDIEKAILKFRKLTGDSAYSTRSYEALVSKINELKLSLTGYRQSFLVHFRNKLIPVAATDIAFFYTRDENTFAYGFDQQKHLLSYGLEELQQQLDPLQFFRINRQFIVQRKSIEEVSFYFTGRLLIKLKIRTPEDIIVSKARSSLFKEWMNR